jgi:uncharacterized C2H2 Zn-finger protein
VRKRVVLTFCGIDWVEDNREVPANLTIRVIAGDSRSYDLDLCAEHAGAYPLARLAEEINGEPFVTHYGTPADGEIFGLRPAVAHPVSPYGKIECPICGETRTTRVGGINHLTKVHGLDRIEASHRLPPTGESIDCEVCGFLCQIGQGYGAHVRVEHGAKTWERIQKTLSKK